MAPSLSERRGVNLSACAEEVDDVDQPPVLVVEDV